MEVLDFNHKEINKIVNAVDNLFCTYTLAVVRLFHKISFNF